MMETNGGKMLRFKDMYFKNHDEYELGKFKNAKIGILGLNNIGSELSVFLAKEGLGELYLADDEIIEIKHLAFSFFDFDDVDKNKANAIKQKLSKINPYLTCEVFKSNQKQSLKAFFSSCDVIIINTKTGIDFEKEHTIKTLGLPYSNHLQILKESVVIIEKIKEIIFAK